MFCCILAALLLGPLGLWAMPRARTQDGPDCCTGARRKTMAIAGIAIAVAALCLAAVLLSRSGPSYFRHICSVWAPP
jgi:hypothetical protein